MQFSLFLKDLDLYGLFALIAIASSLFIAYIIMFVLSFVLMNRFKAKIKKQSEKVNIIIYQKFEVLTALSEVFDTYIKPESRLKHLTKNEIRNYISLSPSSFSEAYLISNQLASRAQKIYVDNEFNGKKASIDILFESLYDLDNKYYESIQTYNSYVIGYNYWRNLLFTRWIKNLFKIKKIEPIN